eukprot:3561081-Ditylum_brightwellii.AAC.1
MLEIVSSNGTEVIDKYFKATAPLQNLDRDEWPQQPPPSRAANDGPLRSRIKDGGVTEVYV